MEQSFQIFIALPTDDVCTVRDLSNEMRIYQLKSRVELKTGIPGDIQHLFFMDKELHDNIKLEDAKVNQGCIVRMKLESTWAKLFDACWRGDIYEVFQNGVQFLDENEFRGYNISLWNRLVIQRATNALFIAAHRGFLGLIMELLNHAATDINGKTRFGRTSLHVAAYQGFVGCVSLLLSEGALCNQIDYNGKTALALASENGHIYCERRLWLYQMNLKRYAVSSPKRSSDDDKARKETTEEFPRRMSPSGSGKGLHLNGNKARIAQGEEKQDYKKFELHLPRVQSTDGQRNTSSTPGPDLQEHSTRAQFPLVQIAEKYRREYREKKESNLPNTGTERPQTAPNLHGQKGSRETKSKDALDQVEEANAIDSKHDEKPKNKDVKESQENAPVSKTGSDDQTSTSEDKEQEESRKDRPESSRASSKRHLDVVISTSRLRSKSEESRPVKSEENSTQDTPSLSGEPAIDHDYMDVTAHPYRPRKQAPTFDSWLEKKRTQGQLRPATAHAPEKSKIGKAIEPEAFKTWLSKKRYRHYRSFSESSNSSPRKTYISSGLTFDKWLEEKKKMAGKEKDGHVMEPSSDSSKKARVILAGKSYEEWLNEKLAQTQSQSKENEENDKNVPKSGKTYEMWLMEKKNQKQIEMIHKATTEKEKQRRLEYEQYQKHLNPNCRTFDEWLAIKQQEHLLERVRVENEPKEDEVTSEDKKKDARTVFDIWLTMKFVKEMKEEEENYKEMREKWERKEKQREALRRLIHMNNAIKQQSVKINKNKQLNQPTKDVVDDNNDDEIMECIED